VTGEKKGLKCPSCGSNDHKVVDSRGDQVNHGRWRRRLCGECDKRFTTVELVTDDSKRSIRQTSNARWTKFEDKIDIIETDLRKLKDTYRVFKKQHREDVLDFDALESILRDD